MSACWRSRSRRIAKKVVIVALLIITNVDIVTCVIVSVDVIIVVAAIVVFIANIYNESSKRAFVDGRMLFEALLSVN